MRLLVDVSGLIYRSAYAMGGLSHKGKKTGAAFGTMKALGHLADLYEPEEMVICWDDGHEHQSRLYPEYKADRKKDPTFVRDLERQKVLLRAMLAHLPVVQLSSRGIEADDIIAVLAKFLQHERAGIVTGDSDLYCLSSKRCLLITNDGVRAELELPPEQYVAYKVLVGGEDNIKGVAGIGPVKAKALLERWGTLDRILDAAKSEGCLGKDHWKIVHRRVKRNLQLMTPGAMLTEGERASILGEYKEARLECRTDKAAFREALMDAGFVSIVARLKGYLMPFAKMERRRHGQAQAQATTEGARGMQDGAASRHGDQGAASKSWTRIVCRVERCVPVVCAASRGEGARGVGGVEGEAEAPPQRGAAARAAAVLARIRAQAAVGVAAPSGRPRAAGAVRNGDGQARHVGAGRAAAGILHDAEVPSPKPARGGAVSVLQALRRGDGWQWLKTRPSKVLRRVLRLLDLVCRGKQLQLEDVDFVERLARRYEDAMPAWMKTDKELKTDAENLIRNVRP